MVEEMKLLKANQTLVLKRLPSDAQVIPVNALQMAARGQGVRAT